MAERTLIMLVGIPGSGKSTFAEKVLSNCYNIVSSDSIRAKYWGSEEVQPNPSEVFDLVIYEARELLKYELDVVIDATNVRKADRQKLIKNILHEAQLKREDVNVICYYFEPDVVHAKAQNLLRDRKVPNVVIERYVKRFEVPTVKEGFDYVFKIEV